MSEYIEVGQPLQFTDPNTPTRVGEIVENVSDIYNIPSPRLGMQVFVKSEKKSYVITSLKNKVINGVDVPEAAVEAFEPVGAKSITWNNDTDPSNMNDFTIAGVYDIKGEHTRMDDNLPILNAGGGHSFNARLTVLDSSITGSGKDDDKCITQVLSFSNRLGQGEVYIRTGKGSSLDNLTWEKWSTLQRNVNVSTVTSLDHLVDNGIYSGVLKKGPMVTDYETFVMVVINDYAVTGEEKRVSQFKYGLNAYGEPSYESRYSYIPEGYTFPTWTEWEILNQKEISSMIKSSVDNAIKGIIADAPEAFDTLKEIADWIANDETGAVALANAISTNTKAINTEVTRAIQAEQTINDKLNTEIERSVAADQDLLRSIDDEARRATEAEEAIKDKAVEVDSLNFQTRANVVALDYKTIEGVGDEITIPAATAESAGVMSAEDKVALDKAVNDIADEITRAKAAEEELKGKIGNISGTMLYEVGYDELVSLRNNASLVEGALYRITDYATMTAQADTSSAGHAFDIIVEALDKDVLSEDAKAVWHDGDDYFAECDLTAWTLKYCLDNDTSRFAWADAENGKGVIYYMKDERDNECPYDFKNIMFKDYFTFSYTVNGVIYDGTIRSEVKNCYGNIIKQRWINGVQELNSIVFKNTLFGNYCYSNTFGYNCYSNTFGNYCYSNTFGNNCYSNTFGNNCGSNTFGNYCYSNTFGYNCGSNTFGNNCGSNTFGNNCYSNTFGYNCGSNTFGNYCYSNTFGNNCYSNTFGYGCNYRRIDDSKLSITLNDEYYDDGSGQFVPIKHPDLSTQPSILPYKFMGQYVYEQLIPTSNLNIELDNMLVLSSVAVGIGMTKPVGINCSDGNLIPSEDISSYMWLKIVYTSMPEEGGYYGYNNY